MGDQVIYLEKYIDSTTSLPAELNRILASIKDLDERSDDLAAQIQENVELALRMPPASAASGARKGAGEVPRDVQDLRDQIDKDQQLLIQFAEEKVQLAVQGYDLLEQHLGQADLDIVHLEAELHHMGLGDTLGGTASMGGGQEYSGGTFDEPAPKRGGGGGGGGGSRMRDVPSFDSFEQAAPPEPKPQRKTTITLNLSRQMSGFEGAPGTGEAQTPGVDSLGVAAAAPQKRPLSTAPRKAVTPAPQPVAPPSEGYQRNRRAAAAGVHAVAAEVAAMEEDDMAPEEHAQHAQHAQQMQHAQQVHQMQQVHRGAGGGGALQQPMVAVQQVAVAHPVPGVQQMFQQAAAAGPVGLAHAADRPQAPGRLITYADINTSLIGRHAELYWPAENQWYLVVIQGFDPTTHKASIVYPTTGEHEELSLDEIVKEGHMSLIHQR